MKRKKVSLLKLGILLITSSWFLWNCSLEEHHFEKEHPEFTNVETVSFKDAISHFKIKQEEILQKRALARNQENTFDVTPNWNSIQHEELFQIDQAQLTLADATINREGDYESKLFFLNINNTPEVVIFTLFPKEIDGDGKLLEASFFYNKLDGSFIDGFKIEEGKLSKRYLLKSTLNTQEAGFLMLFQGKEEDDDFWCDDGTGGVLDEVSLGTVSNSGGGISVGPTSSTTSVSLSYASVNWYYLGNGNSTGRHQLSGGGISTTSGASSLYIQTKNSSEDEAYDPNKDPATGKCKYGYKMNPATGKCEQVNTDCTNGKVYNDTTKKCECPEGKVEDSNGNCVQKPCKGNPIRENLEIAPQKGVSGTKGALHGCTRFGGTCKGIGGRSKFHAGIDIKSSYGTPIHAMYDGFIYSSRYHKKAGYNTRIQSTVNGKTILISYFHLQKENRILQGNPLVKVKAGDIIGYQGDSGNLKSAIEGGGVDSHVHIEVREHDGSNKWGYNHFILVDPRDYFATKIKDDGTSEPNTNCN
ncbi:M23 family metallopeptidase [uncultured Tenacibaculum sp.]|uniref:M23 family metallopeptidase n=1 Tax=uncultured Tenacibaculum sp. TaxID=174713 RepID=UPI00261051AF|nr:M23 family metallopeptidase [uncultured Tenacibaculum sp.]